MTIYHVTVDRSLCSGFGACVDLAPDVFALEGGIATVCGTSDDPAVLDAVDACPMGAIAVRLEEAA